jgi:predicted secreted hydrolase
MRPDPTMVAVVLVLAVGLLATPWSANHDKQQPPAGNEQLSGVLGGGAEGEGFARVTGPRGLDFPADHGAHPDYRSEWWYFTGNLTDAAGRDYGFQLTLFRFALAPSMPERSSAWATRQAWMGHFAITDIASGEHVASERLQRGALGLAGVASNPFRGWIDDWSVRALPEAGEDMFPLRLRAATTAGAVELTLRSQKPRVLQGEGGYSPKSDEPGNASHYYSYTRLAAEGRLRTTGAWRPVKGSAWLDREWSTSALAADQAGWDWFALQLTDGRDVMVYRLRGRDGRADKASYGVVVDAAGEAAKLGVADFELTPRRYWTSPATGTRYPIAWRLRIPEHDIDARVEARVDDQLMDLGFRYWEGSVRVTPGAAGSSVRGVGYLEMTGY